MNIIALDDELPALRILEHYCAGMKGVLLKKVFTNPNEAVHYIRHFPVNLILLDINMPTITGLDFYHKIKDEIPVVFTTAHHEFAVNAFDIGAIDYLLKPFSQDRFEQAINKAKRYMNQQIQELSTLTLRSDYKLIPIQVKEILLIEAYDDYVKIHTVNTKVIVVRATLKSILDKLPTTEFVRVHRSYVIPIVKITAIRNKIIYIGNKEIPIGKAYEETLFQLIKKDN